MLVNNSTNHLKLLNIEKKTTIKDVGHPVPGFGQAQIRNLLPIDVLGY